MSNSFIRPIAKSISFSGVLFVFLTKPCTIKNISGLINTKNNLIWTEDFILSS